MNRESFIVSIKTEDIYIDLTKYIEQDLILQRPLPRGNSKQVIGLTKDELGGQKLTQFAALTPKTYSYLMKDQNAK